MDHHTTLLLTPTAPMQARIDSLFHLRTLGTPTAIHTICAAFHSTDSDLLLHELAYVLGQIGSTRALPHLYEVLHSKTKVYTPIVRHEAAEAIGAIGQMESIEILEKYADPATEPEKCVYETCQIAVELIKEAQKKGKRHGPTGYVPSQHEKGIAGANSIMQRIPLYRPRITNRREFIHQGITRHLSR